MRSCTTLVSVVEFTNMDGQARVLSHQSNEVDYQMSECGCGRSPTGKCVGWHNLTEDQYLEKKAAWDAKQAEKSENKS